jgi:hypothetical protein
MACKCRIQQTFRTNKKVTEFGASLRRWRLSRAVYLTDGELQICGENGDADDTGLQEDPPLSENPVWPENVGYSCNQRNSLGTDHIGDNFSKRKVSLGGRLPGRGDNAKPQFSESPPEIRISHPGPYKFPCQQSFPRNFRLLLFLGTSPGAASDGKSTGSESVIRAVDPSSGPILSGEPIRQKESIRLTGRSRFVASDVT